MKTKVLFSLACAALLFTTMAGHFVARAQSTVTIQGIAFCRYHPVVGVWIASTNSGSGWSSRYVKISGDGHIVSFYRENMAVPANMSIHVGCGSGSAPGSWWSDNHTPDIGVGSNMILKTICNDVQSGTTNNCQFVPAAEAAAYNWANLQYGKKEYIDECLTFVDYAYWYGAGIIDIVHNYGFKLPVGREPFPSDIWPQIASHSVKGQVGTDTSVKTPPAGAWVFFMPNDGTSYWLSHVELSKGDGTQLSTYDAYDQSGYIHTETIAQHDNVASSHYVGWWLPDM
jgi:hypothetical protein